MKDIQVSAYLSRDVKEQLERLSRRKGLKKGFIIEQALRYHLQAMRELPEDVMIPPALVLGKKAFARLVRRLERPEPPSPQLRKLMRGEPISDHGLH